MDQGRKKTLCVCATILAAPKLTDLQDGKSAALQTEITQIDVMFAILKPNHGNLPKRCFRQTL